MSDNTTPRVAARRDSRGEKGGALTLTLAVIAWGVALVHLVNGFTARMGNVEVRWGDDATDRAAARATGVLGATGDGVVLTGLQGRAELLPDVFLHRAFDKIDLIAFFALVGVALFLTHRLARRGHRGAKDVLEGVATARWLGIALVAVGVVPPLAQAQATRARLADAGLADVLAPADPALGWGWVVAGLAVALAIPALWKASRKGRD
ncbi:hypothetical protein [Oerskovia turbata]